MSMIRAIVDLLDAEGLRRLMELRTLGTRPSNNDRRKALALSYRGDLEALFRDLRREDFFTVLGRRFILGTERYEPKGVNSLSLPELQRAARQLFVNRSVPDVFVNDRRDSDVEIPEPDPQDSEEMEPVESEPEEAPVESPFADLDTTWSRPRLVTKILEALGERNIPQRMSRQRFTQILEDLDRYDVEVADIASELLTTSSLLPSIHDRLRLRRKGGSASASAPLASFSFRSLGYSESGSPMLATIRCEVHPARSDGKTSEQHDEMLELVEDLFVRTQHDFHLSNAFHEHSLRITSEPAGFAFGDAELVDLGAAIAVVGALSRSTPIPTAIAVGSVKRDGNVVSLRRVEALLATLSGADANCKILMPAHAHESLAQEYEDRLHPNPIATLAEAMDWSAVESEPS